MRRVQSSLRKARTVCVSAAQPPSHPTQWRHLQHVRDSWCHPNFQRCRLQWVRCCNGGFLCSGNDHWWIFLLNGRLKLQSPQQLPPEHWYPRSDDSGTYVPRHHLFSKTRVQKGSQGFLVSETESQCSKGPMLARTRVLHSMGFLCYQVVWSPRSYIPGSDTLQLWGLWNDVCSI